MSANAEIARRAYEAFLAGDTAVLGELMADDIVWHSGGNNPLSGTYRGQAEVFGLFAKIGELTDGPYALEIHDIVANDEHAIALVRTKPQRAGRELDSRAVHVWHLAEGKLTEFWTYPEDPSAVDEFWS